MKSTSTDRKSITIDEFCRENGLTRRGFYSLLSRGCAPRVMKLGNTQRAPVRIPVEERDAWVKRHLMGEKCDAS